jgi:pimeloyl-ACP methyl ester carboxylesterase
VGLRYGHGSEHIFYFHGFGQKCDSVKKFLSESLLESFTIHSIGLFFHESTLLDERSIKSPLESDELISFMNAYTKMNGITHFHLMGYSMGARLCFDLLLHNCVKSIFVIAPDGISKNIWHSLFTQSTVLNRLVLTLVNNSGISHGLTTFLYSIGLISDYEKRLIQNNIHSSEALKKVFSVWVFYSKIYPSFGKWTKVLLERGIPHYFMFGKKDKIITNRAANKMLKHTNNVEIVNDGHDLVKEKYSGKVSDFFLNLSEKQIIS